MPQQQGFTSIPIDDILKQLNMPSMTDKFSTEEKENIASRIVDAFHYASGNMETMKSTWTDIIDAYNGEKAFTTPTGVKKPKDFIHSPLILSSIDELVAQNSAMLLSTTKNFIEVRDPSTKQRMYHIENFLFDTYVREKYGFEMAKAIGSAALLGVGIVKILPDYESGTVRINNVNNFDFYIDPYATCIEDAEFIIHKIWLSRSYIQSQADAGVFDSGVVDDLFKDLPLISKVDTGKVSEKIPTLYQQEQTRSDLRSPEDDDLDKFGRYEVVEYYCNEYIITVAEEKYILSIQVNYIGYPFQAFYLRIPKSGEFWVKSHGELLLNLQNEVDVKRNQRIDNINKIINAPVVIQQSSMPDVSKFIISENNRIVVTDINGHKFVEIPDVTQQVFQEEAAIKNEASEITSVTNVVRGQPAKQARMSTTEANQLFSQSMSKFDFMSDILASTGIVATLKMVVHLFALLGKELQAPIEPNGVGAPVPIMPADLAKDFDISVLINPNKQEQDRQTAMVAYQLFSQNPYIDQQKLLTYIIPLMLPDYPKDLIKQMPDMMQGFPNDVQLSNNQQVPSPMKPGGTANRA